VFFQAENAPKPFSAGALLRAPLGSLWHSPRSQSAGKGNAIPLPSWRLDLRAFGASLLGLQYKFLAMLLGAGKERGAKVGRGKRLSPDWEMQKVATLQIHQALNGDCRIFAQTGCPFYHQTNSVNCQPDLNSTKMFILEWQLCNTCNNNLSSSAVVDFCVFQRFVSFIKMTELAWARLACVPPTK